MIPVTEPGIHNHLVNLIELEEIECNLPFSRIFFDVFTGLGSFLTLLLTFAIKVGLTLTLALTVHERVMGTWSCLNDS